MDKNHSYSSPLPTRAEVEVKLMGLIDGSLTREQAADWAAQWEVMNDQPVDDWGAWDALEALSMADGAATDRPYLFEEADFVDWLHQLSASGAEYKD